MNWEEIKNNSKKPDNNMFAVVGRGRIKLSRAVCQSINCFDECNYATFLRAKRDRVYFVGLKFCKANKGNAIKIIKNENGVYGVSIIAPDLIGTLYGEEGSAKEYTKHNVVFDPKDPDIVVIYYNYKTKVYIGDDEDERPIRGKHIGNIVDKEWKVIRCFSKNESGKNSPMYLLRNVNTGEEIKIFVRALIDIEKGYTTIEKIKLSHRIGVGRYCGKMRAAKKKRLSALDKIGNNKK